MDIKGKKNLRKEIINFIKSLFDDTEKGDKAYTKLDNICGKTGRYGVPKELFQERTSRKNRVLLPWKEVKKNELTIEQLETFSGGVVVEFVNEDYFEPSNQKNPVFVALKHRLGGNDVVSSIITIRSEAGSSSSAIQRDCYARLISGTKVIYNGAEILIDKDNYNDYLLERVSVGGMGNEKWTGFLYISIRGGQQKGIQTHEGKKLLLFNPACEFANAEVLCDIDLVMLYFALCSVDVQKLSLLIQTQYNEIKNRLQRALTESCYESDCYTGNLFDYCSNHLSTLNSGSLMDPIQALPIYIEDFSVDDKNDSRNLDFTHNEAVKKKSYYWDKKHNCLLSAARPTNAFWSKHTSNMMQQDMGLDEYLSFEENNIARRKHYLNKN